MAYLNETAADLVARAIPVLNKLTADTDESQRPVYLGTIPVVLDSEVVGELRDEIGGEWAFYDKT